MSFPSLPPVAFDQAWHEFFAALVRELDAEKTRLNNEIEALKTANAEQDATITALTARVDSVETDVADHETRITDLEP